MKFNLKNRPSLKYPSLADRWQGLVEYHDRCEKWFEGFEKELREKRPTIVIVRPNPKHSKEFYAEICLEWEKIFKEILEDKEAS